MQRYLRRQFLQDSMLAAGAAAVFPPSSFAVPPQGGKQTRDPIIEHFTGDFDGYIPPLIGNGEIGGTFDPFCGTWFDELRSIPGQKEDIRSLLHARFRSQDYWEVTRLDPTTHPLTEETKKYIAAGKENTSSVTRGSPFEFYLGPPDKDFPTGVQGHSQRLDFETGILSAEYSFSGRKFHVECFVHPRLSLLAYRVRAGGAAEFRIKANKGVRTDGDALIAESASNIFCPALAGIYAEGGRPNGDRIALPPGESVLYFAYGHPSLGDPKGQIAAVLGEARQKGYAALRAEQTRWWADFWGRSDISIPDERMQQMYYRSLYYIAASLPRRTKTPASEAGLSGSFPTFLTGYHIQDSVYQVFPMLNANHLELVEPMLEWYLDVLPVARETARSVYWLKGARYIWHGGPGMLTYVPGHTHYGPCLSEHHVNGWVVLSIERYLNACGWDKDKARRYYPVVADIARFFSSMLEPRGRDKLQIRYLPSHSQAESEDTVDKPNIFDVLASAKWSLMVASRMSRLLGIDEAERRRWESEAERIDFSVLRRSDGAYALFEGDDGVRAKVCAQFISIICPIGPEKESLLATYKYLQKHVVFGSCAWDPGYAAIALARLGETELAVKHLSRIFNEGYTEEPWIMFRESAPFWLKARRGNMPYYLGAHALYAQAIHEMLVQDWTGKRELFRACPFENASFRLRTGDQMVEAKKVGSKVTRLDASPAV